MKKNYKKLVIISILALFGTCCVAMAEENEPIIIKSPTEEQVQDYNLKSNRALFEQAQTAFNNKDYISTILYLNNYLSSKPKKYEAYWLRGDAYYELRQYAQAEQDYKIAIDIKTSEDKFMTNTKYIGAVVLGADKKEQLQNAELGAIYARLMYAQKAQNNPAYATAYENAIKYNSHIYLPQPNKLDIAQINCPQKYGKKVNPQGIDVYIYGAIDDIEKHDYNSAIFKIQKVVSAYPNYYLGHYLYGVALVGLDKEGDAIGEFYKSLSLNPNDFESYASLGQIYFSRAETTFSAEDSKKSMDYFKRAAKLNPNCYIYYFYIGLNELQAENNDKAIENFNKAIDLNESDYNSKYYKLIAQYNKGDYDAVVKGTTSLLYRHVSNYNSVNYLRALAYYRMGNNEGALKDLDTIINGIDDIYNSDIKAATDRDSALLGYAHYLKYKINSNAADKIKALQNPIIAQLSRAEGLMKPYKDMLSGDTIKEQDYRKFESFYNTSLPKVLASGIVLTDSEVENQYDYIRTTFSDLGLTFKYLNPGYKLTTVENYPSKKYYGKIPKEQFLSTNTVVAETQPTIKLRSATPQKDMIVEDSSVSLAKMIAMNSIPVYKVSPIQKSETIKPVVNTLAQENNIQNADLVPQTPAAEKIKISSNIASGDPFIYKTKNSPLETEKNTHEIKEILNNEQRAYSYDTNMPVYDEGKITVTAEDFKETPDVVISYQKPTQVTQKVADINPADYGVQVNKTPKINKNDEIVELDQKALMNKLVPELSVNNANNNLSPKKATRSIYENVQPSAGESLFNDNPITLAEDNSLIKAKAKDVPVAVAISQVPEINAAGLQKQNKYPVQNNYVKASDTLRSTAQRVENTSKDITREIVNVDSPDIQSVFETGKVKLTKDEKLAIKSEQKALKAEQKAQNKAQKEKDKLLKEQEKLQLKAQKANEKLELASKSDAEIALMKAEQKAQKEAQKTAIAEQKAKAKLAAETDKELQKIKKEKEKTRDDAAKKAEETKTKSVALLRKERENEKIKAKNNEIVERLKHIKAEIQNRKEQERLIAQTKKEQLIKEREQAKAELEAKKAKDTEIANAQKEQLKKDREQAKVEFEARKAKEAAIAEVQKEQLKNEREQAKAELEAKKAKDAEIAERKKEQLIKEREQVRAIVDARKAKDAEIAEAQKEQLKKEREQAKVIAEVRKAKEAAIAEVQKEQLKNEREQAKAELEIRKAKEAAIAEAQKVQIKKERDQEKAIQQINKTRESVILQAQKEQQRKEKEQTKAIAQAQKEKVNAIAQAQKDKLRKEKEQAKVIAQNKKARETAIAKAKKEQLRKEKEQAKAIIQARKEKETAIVNAQKEQLRKEREQVKAEVELQKTRQSNLNKMQNERLRQERAKAKAELKLQKAKQASVTKAQNELIKQERARAKTELNFQKSQQASVVKAQNERIKQAKAQAKAQMKAKADKEKLQIAAKKEYDRQVKIQNKARLKAQKANQKAIANTGKKYNSAEKNVNNKTKKQNNFIKNLFQKFKKNETNTDKTQKTVLKKLNK